MVSRTPDPNRRNENGPSSFDRIPRQDECTNGRQLIVVGAGSAGCLLASRLAGEFGIHVTLLEPPPTAASATAASATAASVTAASVTAASVTAASAIDLWRPARWLNLLGSTEDWDFKTEPNANLAARSIAWPRGRGLGGSSRINAMIWFPPTTIDLSMLCEASDNRWNLAELESAYRSVESLVRPESPSWLSEPSQQFLATVAGCTRATPMVYQRLCRRGRRWLPCELLRADKGRVAIVRGVADRLIWENETVVGVHVRGEHDDFDLRASDGVVITAGAIATPLILMRSGVGTREDLDRHGIDARLECSALGNHLSDHLIMPVVFERQTSSEPFRALPTMQDLARWQVMGSGPIASNLAECGGLFQDQSLQFHVTPTHYLTYPKQDAVASMTIGVNVTQPQSTGQIRLRSKRPEVAPEIAPGYLNHEADLAGTLVGIRLARELAERSPLAESIRLELIPGDKRSSDDALTRAIGRYAQTLYHPVGTCRIGQVADSVIDHNFAVRGSSNLWVVDASILPGPTVGNPNATVMTLAWWAAERIAHQL